MKFEPEVWTLKELIDIYESGKLNLNPPYQRNEIWSTNAKKLLIDSIKKNYPLPNFFIYNKSEKEVDMVDGQQRTRTILGYYNKLFPDLDKKYYDKEAFKSFLDYKIMIIGITSLDDGEAIEEFYARVNSTGIKLNRPELKKAEYYNTRFLELLQELASDSKFEELGLFTESSLNRMNDVDFVSELVAQFKFGITDKKLSVDSIFENDISIEEAKEYKDRFHKILKIFEKLNSTYPIKKTRYKQRNDFYTLFGFINNNIDLNVEHFIYFYKILIFVDEDITPSNNECEPFQEYARNCVTQSNSKKARNERLEFFNNLLLNDKDEPNAIQNKIMQFYRFGVNVLSRIDEYYTLNVKELQEIVKEPILDFN